VISSHLNLISSSGPRGHVSHESHVDAVVKARSEGRSAQSRRFVVHVAWAFASALASGRSMEIGRMVSPQRGLRWDVVHVEDREEERCDGTVGIIADARWLVYRPIAVRA
jgi:hypothetical protein